METHGLSQEKISQTIQDFESRTGKISSDVQLQASRLLEARFPSIIQQKVFINESTVYSDALRSETVKHISDSLRLFYDIIRMIDPKLQYLPVFQGMYRDIVQSFMYDLQELPVFQTVSFDEKKCIVSEAVKISQR